MNRPSFGFFSRAKTRLIAFKASSRKSRKLKPIHCGISPVLSTNSVRVSGFTKARSLCPAVRCAALSADSTKKALSTMNAKRSCVAWLRLCARGSFIFFIGVRFLFPGAGATASHPGKFQFSGVIFSLTSASIRRKISVFSPGVSSSQAAPPSPVSQRTQKGKKVSGSVSGSALRRSKVNG